MCLLFLTKYVKTKLKSSSTNIEYHSTDMTSHFPEGMSFVANYRIKNMCWKIESFILCKRLSYGVSIYLLHHMHKHYPPCKTTIA